MRLRPGRIPRGHVPTFKPELIVRARVSYAKTLWRYCVSFGDKTFGQTWLSIMRSLYALFAKNVYNSQNTHALHYTKWDGCSIWPVLTATACSAAPQPASCAMGERGLFPIIFFAERGTKDDFIPTLQINQFNRTLLCSSILGSLVHK
jgi:hypothetical protein